MVSSLCVEFTSQVLGNRACIRNERERHLMHLIARALPSTRFHVNYIDLNFHASFIKVYLLLLASCARLLPH